jgi:hypothetical protein
MAPCLVSARGRDLTTTVDSDARLADVVQHADADARSRMVGKMYSSVLARISMSNLND